MYLLDLFGERGEKEWCVLVCEAPLNDSTNGGSVSVETFTRLVSIILVLRGVGPIGNGYGV